MANITKVQFVNDVNAVLQVLSNNQKDATNTDVSRSNNEITTLNFPAVTVGELPSSNVSSSELQAMLENFTQQFAQVRTARFYLNINGTYSYQYTRYARISTSAIPHVDTTYTSPVPATFDNIQPLHDIDLIKYQNILSTLQSTLNTNYGQVYKNYYYCHSSCHSSCHASRGRR